jgi:hypothetical protein
VTGIACRHGGFLGAGNCSGWPRFAGYTGFHAQCLLANRPRRQNLLDLGFYQDGRGAYSMISQLWEQLRHWTCVLPERCPPTVSRRRPYELHCWQLA